MLAWKASDELACISWMDEFAHALYVHKYTLSIRISKRGLVIWIAASFLMIPQMLMKQ